MPAADLRPAHAGWVVALLAVLALVGAGVARGEEDPAMPDTRTFTGSATVGAADGLPAGAVLTVTVEDVARADAPAVTLARTRIDLTGGQASVPFSLSYPVSAVDPRGIYTARARVDQGERLLFITTQNTPVDAFDPGAAELVMTPVQAPPPVPDVALTDTYWKLTEVQGRPVAVTGQMREPSLVLNGRDGRFAGSGGVNRLIGGYTLDGPALSFSQIGSTLMAGPPEAMQQEQDIATALQRVRGYRISGEGLTLLDEAGDPVITAVAVALN